MILIKSYIQEFPDRLGGGTCQVGIYATQNNQPSMVLVSQREWQHRLFDAFPQIATLIHGKEGFASPSEIEWYQDCAIRRMQQADPEIDDGSPTLWRMNLEFVTKGWWWNRKSRYIESTGLNDAMKNRKQFFARLQAEDPLVSLCDNIKYDAEERRIVDTILFKNESRRAWFDGVETKPAEMRGMLIADKTCLDEIVRCYPKTNWLFLAKRHDADRAETYQTLCRAHTLDATREKMLTVCDEAEKQANVWVSFAIIAEIQRRGEFASMPVEELA